MKLKKNNGQKFLKHQIQFYGIHSSQHLAINGENSHIIRRHRTSFPVIFFI